MDSSGDFAVCDSCGTKHTKERMKTKAQEVTGTVAISNIEGIDSLMKRGTLALEDSKGGQWDPRFKEAREYFNRVLDIDAEYAPAYIGILCVELQLKAEADLANQKRPLDDKPNYQKALRFADADYRAKVTGYNQVIKDRIAEGQRKDQENFAKYHEKQKERMQKYKKYQNCISQGGSHTVALKIDGTVVSIGEFIDSRFWSNIVAVAAGYSYTIGLKEDGTVEAAGENKDGQCNTGDWRDIVAVAAESSYTIGLKADGTVVATGENKNGQCNTGDWRDIIAISTCYASTYHTLGLKADGTVVSSPHNDEISEWRGIMAISGYAGLKADGTVVVVERDDKDRSNTGDWRDIVAVSARGQSIVGLKADGTVVAVGESIGKYFDGCVCDISDWRDIVAVATSGDYIVGLKANGKVIATGKGYKDWYNSTSYWEDIGPFDREKLRIKQEQQAEEDRKEQELQAEKNRIKWKQQGLCGYCGGKLSGLFTKKCKDCGETQ
jgi:alpha-tubulin suppressor-like RCC1 family protein